MKDLKKQTYILIIIAFILIIVIIGINAYNTGRNAGNVIPTIDQSQVRPGFSATPYAQEAHQLLTNITGGDARQTFFIKLNQLSDAELMLVYNEYNKVYKKEKKTLTQVINNAWLTVLFGTNYKTIVLERMHRLNLP